MASEELSLLLLPIKEFATQQTSIDWTIAWDDEERFGGLLEALDTLIDSIALQVDLPSSVQINLLGRLAMYRSQLTFYFGQPKHAKDFVEVGERITTILHEIINSSNWLQEAETRMEAYQEFASMIEGDEEPFTLEQLTLFRPVFIAIAVLTLITLDENLED